MQGWIIVKVVAFWSSLKRRCKHATRLGPQIMNLTTCSLFTTTTLQSSQYRLQFLVDPSTITFFSYILRHPPYRFDPLEAAPQNPVPTQLFVHHPLALWASYTVQSPLSFPYTNRALEPLYPLLRPLEPFNMVSSRAVWAMTSGYLQDAYRNITLRWISVQSFAVKLSISD